MNTISCIIIEDEAPGIEILQNFCNKCNWIEVKGIFLNAIDPISFLQREKVDFIFLDIQLPELTGLEFLKTLVNPPKIIITTAYHQHAIEAFEWDVVDYLLKPFSFQRFLKAVNKIRATHISEALKSEKPNSPESMFINVNKRRVKVVYSDILYIESLKEYIAIYTQSQKLITKFGIGEIEKELKGKGFLRIHRSFLVAKRHIDAYTHTEIEIAQTQLPIGRSYRQEVWELLA